MHDRRSAVLMAAFLLTSILASCGGEMAYGPANEAPATGPVVLFKISGEPHTLTGVNVYLGSKSGISEVSGLASAGGTEIYELNLREDYRAGTAEFPNGITMDHFSTTSSGSDYVFVTDELGLYKQIYLTWDYEQSSYVAAPVSSNQKPGPEYSELHKSQVFDYYTRSDTGPQNDSYSFYGVTGLATEVFPGGTAEYQGIWVGQLSSSGEYWGDASLFVDFATGETIGLLSNPTPSVPQADVIVGDITIVGNVLEGTITGSASVDVQFGDNLVPYAGDVSGVIYGPSAEEAGGVFDMSPDPTKTVSSGNFSGAFLAKQ